MEAADYIITWGQVLVCSGKLLLPAHCRNLPGARVYHWSILSGKRRIVVPEERRRPNDRFLEVRGAREAI